MQTSNDAERYLEEYRKLQHQFAKWVIESPDMVDELRRAMKASAAMMMSNRPEAVEEFQDATQQMDQFLEDCVSGKLDPRDFLIKDIGQDE